MKKFEKLVKNGLRQNIWENSVLISKMLSQCHYWAIAMPRLLGGLLASTHFMLIFCTTWLGVGPSFEYLEQTLPKEKRDHWKLFYFYKRIIIISLITIKKKTRCVLLYFYPRDDKIQCMKIDFLKHFTSSFALVWMILKPIKIVKFYQWKFLIPNFLHAFKAFVNESCMLKCMTNYLKSIFASETFSPYPHTG